MDHQQLHERSDDELEQLLLRLRAAEAALQRRLLEVIAEYDRRQAWKQDGSTNMAQWLTMYGYHPRRANDSVRVAHALQELPALSRTMEEGRTTFDQIREATKLATPETDEELAQDTPGCAVPELELMARRKRGRTLEESRDAHERRELRMRWDNDLGELKIWGRLPETSGAIVEKVIERLALQAPRHPQTGMADDYPRRAADALVEVCSRGLEDEARRDAARASIVIHADASVLEGKPGSIEVQGGPQIAPETLRRLMCDMRWQLAVHDERGCCIGLGRLTRNVPPDLIRLLHRRDGGCTWPGCNRNRWTEAHHIIPVAEGGPTDLDNLALLCNPHHTLIHEGGWSMKGDHTRLDFFRPDGSMLQATLPTYFDTS